MKIDYTKVSECQTEILKIKTDLLNNIENIKKMIDSLDDNDLWQGKGYITYNSKINALLKNFNSCVNELGLIVSMIEMSINNYKKVDKNIQQQIINMHR